MDPIGTSTDAPGTDALAALMQSVLALPAPPRPQPEPELSTRPLGRLDLDRDDSFSRGSREDDPLQRLTSALRTRAAGHPNDAPTQPLTGDPSLSSPLPAAVAAASMRAAAMGDAR